MCCIARCGNGCFSYPLCRLDIEWSVRLSVLLKKDIHHRKNDSTYKISIPHRSFQAISPRKPLDDMVRMISRGLFSSMATRKKIPHGDSKPSTAGKNRSTTSRPSFPPRPTDRYPVSFHFISRSNNVRRIENKNVNRALKSK